MHNLLKWLLASWALLFILTAGSCTGSSPGGTIALEPHQNPGGGGPPANVAPTVALAVQPATGAAPLDVTFTATAADTDGTIAQYEWDLDGDGTFEQDGGTTATFNHRYTTDGTVNAGVKVTDDDGATAQTTVSVVVVVGGGGGNAVSGTVTRTSGLPLPGVTVTLTPGNLSAISGVDGTYSIASVADGSYTATPTLTSHTFEPLTRSVEVDGASVSGMDFVGTPDTAAGLTISGVTQRQTAVVVPPNQPETEPLGSITLGLYPSNSGTALATTVSDPTTGFWSFEGLDPGDYIVRPVTPATGSWFPVERFYIGFNADFTDQSFIDTAEFDTT